MLFWQNHNGAGPPGAGCLGQAGITAVTARDHPPGVGPEVWREADSRKRDTRKNLQKRACSVLPLASWLGVHGICQLSCGSAPALDHMVPGKGPGGQTGSHCPEPVCLSVAREHGQEIHPVSPFICDLCSTVLTPWGPVEYVITRSPDSVTYLQGAYCLS